MSNNDLQNNDMILPGDIGTVKVGNKVRDIKSVFKGNDGSVTITVAETMPEPLIVNGTVLPISIFYPEKKIEFPATEQ